MSDIDTKGTESNPDTASATETPIEPIIMKKGPVSKKVKTIVTKMREASDDESEEETEDRRNRHTRRRRRRAQGGRGDHGEEAVADSGISN